MTQWALKRCSQAINKIFTRQIIQAQKKQIIDVMIALFGISEEEALGRLNRFWRGKPIIGEQDLVYHREPEQQAKNIYYGKESLWWLEGAELRPLPFP